MYNTKNFSGLGCSSCGMGEIFSTPYKKGTPEWQAAYNAFQQRQLLVGEPTFTPTASTTPKVDTSATTRVTADALTSKVTEKPALPIIIPEEGKILGIKKEYAYIGGAAVGIIVAYKAYKAIKK